MAKNEVNLAQPGFSVAEIREWVADREDAAGAYAKVVLTSMAAYCDEFTAVTHALETGDYGGHGPSWKALLRERSLASWRMVELVDRLGLGGKTDGAGNEEVEP